MVFTIILTGTGNAGATVKAAPTGLIGVGSPTLTSTSRGNGFADFGSSILNAGMTYTISASNGAYYGKGTITLDLAGMGSTTIQMALNPVGGFWDWLTGSVGSAVAIVVVLIILAIVAWVVVKIVTGRDIRSYLPKEAQKYLKNPFWGKSS